MKDSNYVKVNSVNPLYLIIDKADGYINKKNGNKYLILDSAGKNKELLMKYTELWNRIKNLSECNSVEHGSTEKVNDGKSGEYEKDFMKIKFNSDDNLPLNKILKIHNMTIVIRSDFEEDGKYDSQAF